MPTPVTLPIPISQLTESTSIALAQSIQVQDIDTPLQPEPITTAFVHSAGSSQGNPIVLLHGFDSSVFEFRRLLPQLADQHNTWAIDLLGFGFTDRPVELPFSPTAIKTHLYYTWKTLIGEPMVLVGASMGGAAAIDFALTYPEAVSHLVLIDSAGYSAGPPLGKFLIDPLGNWATAFLRSPKVRRDVSLKAYADPNFVSEDALACAALHLEHPQWQRALIAFTRSGGYPSFRKQLSQLQPPTLILWGRNDRILGIKDAPRLQQAIPRSQLIWIDQCGHVPHLEQPNRTAEYILDFLKVEP
ncbi:alpha/beta fold hydrolase [Leptolyngbya ohadii]|uniref:alpha/beta fold hydrolase n=1 Tax=Leptolyngbya ohadii TaxID=1962290 RepID=UPI000B59DDD6|nr:alpha/beta fold hydrolase [Leptolyngbya ohadii]